MSVQFSYLTRSYEFRCIFGCYEFDFESEQEAREAFLFHNCICSRDEPHPGVTEVPC